MPTQTPEKNITPVANKNQGKASHSINNSPISNKDEVENLLETNKSLTQALLVKEKGVQQQKKLIQNHKNRISELKNTKQENLQLIRKQTQQLAVSNNTIKKKNEEIISLGRKINQLHSQKNNFTKNAKQETEKYKRSSNKQRNEHAKIIKQKEKTITILQKKNSNLSGDIKQSQGKARKVVTLQTKNKKLTKEMSDLNIKLNSAEQRLHDLNIKHEKLAKNNTSLQLYNIHDKNPIINDISFPFILQDLGSKASRYNKQNKTDYKLYLYGSALYYKAHGLPEKQEDYDLVTNIPEDKLKVVFGNLVVPNKNIPNLFDIYSSTDAISIKTTTKGIQEFTASLDFTCHQMYASLITKKIEAYNMSAFYNGQICILGDKEHYSEDPNLILRAVYVANRYGRVIAPEDEIYIKNYCLQLSRKKITLFSMPDGDKILLNKCYKLFSAGNAKANFILLYNLKVIPLLLSFPYHIDVTKNLFKHRSFISQKLTLIDNMSLNNIQNKKISTLCHTRLVKTLAVILIGAVDFTHLITTKNWNLIDQIIPCLSGCGTMMVTL